VFKKHDDRVQFSDDRKNYGYLTRSFSGMTSLDKDYGKNETLNSKKIHDG